MGALMRNSITSFIVDPPEADIVGGADWAMV